MDLKELVKASKRKAQIAQWIGLMVGLLIAIAVVLPTIATTINHTINVGNSNITGTSATLLAFVPLFLVIAIIVGILAMMQMRA